MLGNLRLRLESDFKLVFKRSTGLVVLAILRLHRKTLHTTSTYSNLRCGYSSHCYSALNWGRQRGLDQKDLHSPCSGRRKPRVSSGSSSLCSPSLGLRSISPWLEIHVHGTAPLHLVGWRLNFGTNTTIIILQLNFVLTPTNGWYCLVPYE